MATFVHGDGPQNDRPPAQPPAAPPRPTERIHRSHLTPGDDQYHEDKRLIAGLTDLNGQLSRYVLRHVDTEAGRAAPTSPDDEHALGMRLVHVGMDVIGRSDRRRRSPRVNGSAVDPDVP